MANSPHEAELPIVIGVRRSWPVRASLTAVSLVAVVLAVVAVTRFALFHLSLPPRGMLADWIGLVLLALVMWWPATKVGNSRREVLFLLIPFYNVFMTAEIIWRLLYLPYADWWPHPADAAKWQQVPHPTMPGKTLFVSVERTAPERARS
jgi:hypothetical protein